MGKGLIGGIANHDVVLKQIHNGDYEDVVLRRFPFHESVTRTACFARYNDAIQYMFQKVPAQYHEALMGRFSRKLIKRIQFFNK